MNANSVVNLTLSVTDQFSAATQAMGNAVQGLIQRLSALLPVLDGVSQQFLRVGSAAVRVLTADIGEALTGIENKLSRFGLSLREAALSASDATKTSLTTTLSAIAPIIDSTLAGIAPRFAATGTSLAGVFQRLPPVVAASLNAVDKAVIGTVALVEEKIARLQARTNQIGNLFGFLSGVREPVGVFRDLAGLATGVAGAIFNATQQIGLFGLGIQALGQLVNSGPLQPLIGQNIELREQLLATQATLASTNKVIQDGFEVTDAKAAILALQGPIEAVITKLREDSLDLVGVTSKDLVPLYQIVAQNAGQVGASLDDARKITINFAATLGTLQVPLFQARQEISSILQGTIDQNSIVAKSLNLTNKQVETWKAQGTLVTELNKRLEGFRAGNALAAQTIGGITSNIQEVIDEVGRLAGAQLIGPITKQLDEIYQGIKGSKDAYAAYVGELAANGLKAAQGIIASIKAVVASTGEAFSQIPLYLFESLANAATGLAQAIQTTLAVLQPFINLFAEMAKVAIAAGGPFLQLFLQFKVASVAIGVMSKAFGTLFQIVEPLGTVLFILSGRTSGLIGLFSSLTSVVGTGAAGFLLAGKNLALIPGAMAAVTSAIPLFGGAIAQLIPQVSQFGIGLISLAQRFPVVQELFTRFASTIPQIALSLQSVAAANGLPLLAEMLGRVGVQSNLAATLNAKFSEAITQASIAARNAVIRLGLIAGAVIAAGFAFDKFILQNKDLIAAFGSLASFVRDVAGSIANFLVSPVVLATAAIGGLAIAIQANLIPRLVELLALQLPGFFLGAANAANALGKAILFISGVNAFQQFANAPIVLGQLAEAAKAGALSLPLLKAAVADLYVTLLPLAATIGTVVAGLAALGVGAVARYQKDLADSQEAFDIYSKQANSVADEAVAIASKLTAAKKSQEKATKDGIALSAQEIESNRKLASSGKLRLEDLKAQIAILEEAKKEAKGDDLKRAFDNQIAGLTVTQRLLEGLVNTIQIAPRDLEVLGTTFEQLALKANTALKAIENPSGDPEIFKKRVTDLIEATKVQRELGAVSFAEAKDRYLKIAQLTTLDQELQQKAAKELTALIKQEGETRAAVYDSLIKEQENRLKAGQADEVEGEREVTRLKLEQIQVRIAALDEQIQAEARLGNAQGEAVKALLNERRSLEADANALSLEDYQRYLDKQIELIGRQSARITDTIAKAEIERNLTIQGLLNEGDITATKAAELKVGVTRDRIQKELALEMAFQEQLIAQQRPLDPAKAEEYEKKVRDSKLKTAQLTLQLAEEEERRQEAVAKVIQENIERRTKALLNLDTAQTQEYQKQIAALNKVGDALAYQNRLLEERQSLGSAIAKYADSELKLLGDIAKTEDEKNRLARAAAVVRLRALRQEQDIERQKLDLQIEQKRIEDARALRQNQIDQLKGVSEIRSAQAALAKEQANPKATPEQIEALKLDLAAKVEGLGLVQQQGGLLSQNAALNRRGEASQRGQLALQQRVNLDQARVDAIKTLPEAQQGRLIDAIRREIYSELGVDSIRQSSTEKAVTQEVFRRGDPVRPLPAVRNLSSDLGIGATQTKVSTGIESLVQLVNNIAANRVPEGVANIVKLLGDANASLTTIATKKPPVPPPPTKTYQPLTAGVPL